MTRAASTQRDLFGERQQPGTSAHGTPPMRLSLEDYVRNWKPLGWEVLVSDRPLHYRPEWGMWEAIRDIVQNALDEAEAYQSGYDAHGLWIKDMGKGVLVRDFLMGAQKQKPPYMRGKFGEGMKLATLALMREGYQVRILTKGLEIWSVLYPQRVQISPPEYQDCICFLWRENGGKEGTIWSIRGYTGPNYHNNFAVNLPKKLLLAQVPAPLNQPLQRFNQLFIAEGDARGEKLNGGLTMGRIYCRDIWLKDIKSPFSYNLWGFEVAPDRHGPLSETEMYADMGRLWMGIKDEALLKILLKMLLDPPATLAKGVTGVEEYVVYEESSHLVINMWDNKRNPVTGDIYPAEMKANRASWQRAWDKVVGEGVILTTEPRYSGMVQHLGYRSQAIVSNCRYALGTVLKTDKELIDEMAERLDEAERVSDDMLNPYQLASLKLARRIARDYPKIGPVNAGIIPPASDRIDRTAGLYEFSSGMIKISTDILESAHKTVAVVIHELGHHEAYRETNFTDIEKASDLSKGHVQAMEDVTANVFYSLAQGNYDAELKDRDIRWY